MASPTSHGSLASPTANRVPLRTVLIVIPSEAAVRPTRDLLSISPARTAGLQPGVSLGPLGPNAPGSLARQPLFFAIRPNSSFGANKTRK